MQDATGWSRTFDLIIDFVFVSDMILNFFTGIQTDAGGYADSLSFIAASYLKSWFVLDLASSIPFDFFVGLSAGSSNNLRSFKLVRILRLVRLLKLIRLVRLSRYFAKVRMRSACLSTRTRLHPS